jgi:endonuclease YncB( thermonuclease family)
MIIRVLLVAMLLWSNVARATVLLDFETPIKKIRKSTRKITIEDIYFSEDVMHPVRVVDVVDGDTIKVIQTEYIEQDQYIETVRLMDIDCYETRAISRAYWQAEFYKKSLGDVLKQGNTSKIILKQLVNKHRGDLYLRIKGEDKYKRILGWLHVGDNIDDMNINEFMLTHGGCEVYVDRSKLK